MKTEFVVGGDPTIYWLSGHGHTDQVGSYVDPDNNPGT